MTQECTRRPISSNLNIAEVRNAVLKAFGMLEFGMLEGRTYDAHGVLLKYTLNPDKLKSFPFGTDPFEYVESRLDELFTAMPGVNVRPFADDLGIVILDFERN